MRVAIRVDASVEIGSGHVMRCLTLAEELQSRGNEVTFICRNHNGNLGKFIGDLGYNVTLLSSAIANSGNSNIKSENKSHLGVEQEVDAKQTADALCGKSIDWIIVDHYSLDSEWHKYMYAFCKNIMVIDDLANRKYECDLILDQTYGVDEESYKDLVPSRCRILTGSSNALLRTQFLHLREVALNIREEQGRVNRVLVTMGGMDPDNVTLTVINGLLQVEWNGDVEINIVLGQHAPHLEQIRSIQSTDFIKVNVISNVNNMAELMLNSDIAIGAGGTTSWERCCMGLPTLMVISAENQVNIINKLSQDGIVINLGWHHVLECLDIKEAIEGLIDKPEEILLMSKKSFSVCDGLGLYRVLADLHPVTNVHGQSVTLRSASIKDINTIYQWQCEPNTRKYFNNKSIPTEKEHNDWMRSKLDDLRGYFNIILCEGIPSGVIRLEPIIENDDEYMVSILIDPNCYNRGIGYAALDIVRCMLPKAVFHAEILVDNESSMNLFRKAGYKFQEASGHFVSTPV